MRKLHLRQAFGCFAVFWFVTTGWLPAQAGLPSWEIRATYHLPGGGGEGDRTVRWRFEVLAELARSDGLWWRVRVRDADGRTPVEGTFLLHPGRGLIAGVQVREYFQAAWHEYPLQQEEPVSRYFQAFGPLPLDFVGRDGLKTDRVQNFRHSAAQGLDGQNTFRREYGIRSEPSPAAPDGVRKTGETRVAQGPCLILRIEDSFSPGSLRWMTWDARLPWWVEYRSPAYTARLVEWEGGTGR
jgi:hypothetical protein